jgi:hypothetical protein
LLLLTGVIPGTHNVGGIILGDLVRHYGPEYVRSVAVLAAPPPADRIAAVAGLASSTIVTTGNQDRPRSGGILGRSIATIASLFRFRSEVRRVREQVLTVLKRERSERVFVVLDNAVLIAIGRDIAKALDVPLSVLVWDPPDYVLRTAGFGRVLRSHLLGAFEATLAAATDIAVVSEIAQEEYTRSFRGDVHLLRHGVLDGMPQLASGNASGEDEWRLGFAGSMYAANAWQSLVSALDLVGWQIAGRRVRILVMSSKLSVETRRPAAIDFLGFRAADEVQKILADCHLTYMPQPFNPELRELCRHSFPTKLGNYLATGRPVFVHAPADGALQQYFQRHPFGASCDSLDPAAIVTSLERLLADPVAYREAGKRALALAAAEFSRDSFARAVDAFLPRFGCEPANGPSSHAKAGA